MADPSYPGTRAGMVVPALKERFLVETAPCVKHEMEVDHYFICRGVRFAVLFRLHNGHPITATREVSTLAPIPEGYESEWEDE